MKEYDLYLPLHHNDGRPIEWHKIHDLKHRLANEFGGLTHFPQANEGVWKLGGVTFRDKIVILRVLSDETEKAAHFFSELKKELCREWDQEDVLIVARDVVTL